VTENRFGVTWQIVPYILPKLLGCPDRQAANRTMQAMLRIRKFDAEAIEINVQDRIPTLAHSEDKMIVDKKIKG